MFLYGREIGLAVTVGASVKLARLCPDNDLQRLSELLDGSLADTIENLMKMAVIMSEAYERRRAFEEEGYAPNPITMAELETLEMDEIGELFTLVTEAIIRDRKQEIQTKPAKGAKKNPK